MKVKFIPILFLLILAFSACAGTDTSSEMLAAETAANSPTDASTVTPEPTQTKIITVPPLFEAESLQDMLTPVPTWTPTLSPTPELQNVRILTEGSGMQSPGPWLVFSTNDGVYLVSEDGSEIGFVPGLIGSVYSAPSGGNYAVLDWEDWLYDLEVRSAQTNKTLFHTNLLDYQGEALEFEDSSVERDFEGSRHYSVGNLNWSHNGDRLAFTGAINQHSMDLYTFNLNTEKLNQITAGLPFEVDAYWTPNDAKILYANVSSLNPDRSGSGYNDWEFFTANPDGTGNFPVFVGVEYGWEKFLGWVSGDQALMYSDIWWCGQFDLRLVNIQNGQIQPVFSDCFHLVGFDHASQTALIWVRPAENTVDECTPELETGLYWVSVPGGQIEQVDYEPSDFVDSIEWDQNASQFLIHMGYKWAYISRSGEVQLFGDKPIMSPNGEWIAFIENNGEHLYITDREGKQRYNLPASEYPIWNLEGDTLYFFHSASLYLAQAPDFDPIQVMGGLSGLMNSPEWVLP